MNPIIKKIYNTILVKNMIKPNDRILVALSGGADSVFLLEVLLKIKELMSFEIYCAHLNHGIRGKEALRDQLFCQELCERHNIDIYMKQCDIPTISKEKKISEETCGRIERYAFFDTLCQKYKLNKIAVAHNMNDSVETTIFNLIRGASLKGLGGIDCINGNIIRPILNITRDEIESYLAENDILFCTDSTNSTMNYTRNKIRHILIKYMKEINPAVINTIYTNSINLNLDNDFMDTYTENLDCIFCQKEGVHIKKSIYDNQHIAIKKRILLRAFSLINGNNLNIGTNHIDILLNELKSGHSYDMPNKTKVYVSFDEIIFTNIRPENTLIEKDFIPEHEISFNEEITIQSEFVNEYDVNDKTAIFIDSDKFTSDKLTLRNKKTGDRIIPLGMTTSKKVNRLFIELKIPSTQRNCIPILCDNDNIVAILPYRISDMYKVTAKTTKILKIKIKNNVRL